MVKPSNFEKAFKDAEAVRTVGNAARAALEQDAARRARFARSVGEPYFRSLAPLFLELLIAIIVLTSPMSTLRLNSDPWR